MPGRRDHSERLAELQAKRSQLEARIVALSARDAAQQRKDDDRRRVLLGSMLLDELASGDAQIRAYVCDRTASFIKTDRDRALFANLLNDGNMK